MENVYIVIPAYNEEKKIVSTISSIKSEGFENIVLVDDGSKDHTSEVAESQSVIVLKHIINRGQGAALQTGITYALKSGAEYIVNFDADGQHDPKQIKDLLVPLFSKETEVSLG